MAHVMILGMTLSGKTSLAKRLIKTYRAQGVMTGVLDPLDDPTWEADFQTSDVDAFLSRYWQARQCAWFIDEAGDSAGQFDKAMHKTATRGRHLGHRNHYLSQRGVQIARTIRDQCSSLFLFTTALNDCKVHADEWNKPELRTAHTLPQGHYFYTDRFSALKRGQLF